MKSLVNSVGQQIQQLESYELKQFLLRHLNSEASCITELFCKYYAVDAKTTFIPAALSTNPIFCLIYTFGPQLLIEELHTLFSSLPPMNFDSFKHELSAQCTFLLEDFVEALPFIKQLQQQPHNIITLMTEAKSTELEAFRRLNPESDWALLTEAFLIINDHQELPLTNRWKLINFLRHPHWIEQNQKLISLLLERASALLSMEFLLHAFGSQADASLRLKKLYALGKNYHLPVHGLVLKHFIANWIGQLPPKKELSLHKSFIMLLDELWHNISHEQQTLIIHGLDLKQLMDFIEQSIEIHRELDADCVETNKRILFLLCTQLSRLHSTELELVRNRLNHVETHFLADDKQENNRYPLARALLAPRFMALASTEVIEQLILRLHCFILTLKHEELLYFLASEKELSPYYQPLIARLNHLEVQLTDSLASRKDELRDEKQQLINWCIERFTHAFFTKLIRSCQTSKGDGSAAQALTQVYRYYITHYPTLRVDLLFGAVNHFYGLTEEHSNWLEQKCQSCFVDYDWNRVIPAADIHLYNQQGICVSLVDEGSRVWSLENTPTLLGDEQSASSLLYDRSGTLASPITASGYFRYTTTLSQELSPTLLSGLSKEELLGSEVGFSLLIKQLLLQNNIALLYKTVDLQSEQGQLKLEWLEERIAHAIQEALYHIDASTFASVAHYVHSATVFSLWASIHYTSNALTCFHSLINNRTLRELFFSAHYDEHFYGFLNHHGAALCFADYLLQHHQKPWFTQGLACFVRYLDTTNNRSLLPDSLDLLFTKVTEGKLSDESFNAVLRSLISSEQAATILLQGFWGDQQEVAVQYIRTATIDETATHVNKSHLLFLIEQLNALSAWQQSPFYRIVLFTLQSQHQRLLPPLGEEGSLWHKNELKQFALFINRHLEAKNPSDSHSLIGFKVLGALLFHCAATGLTDLFFKDNGTLSRITSYSIPSLLLAQLVDNVLLPSIAKGTRRVPTVNGWSDWVQQRGALAQRLSDSPLFQEYHTLIIQTHNKATKKIPVLCVYLLHYSGAVDSVSNLLEQYFSIYAPYQALIHPVSDFLITFPERGISAVIFSSLQHVLLSNPQFLDKVLLGQMAAYYCKQNGLDEREAVLQLIATWGHAKYYSLVQHACTILLVDCSNNTVKPKLMKALIEAQVEQELQSLVHSNTWYSNSIVWFKRVWSYGFRWQKNTSQLLTLCDEETNIANLFQCAVAEIEIPEPLVKEKGSEQYQQLINLLAEVLRSSITRDQNGFTHGEQKHLFYKPALESFGPLQEVASHAVLVNV